MQVVLGTDELDRLADDGNPIIRTSLYCANCGYNLRSLPVVYQCPECAQAYNARPSQMKGIFREDDTVYFPLLDVFVAALSLAAAVGCIVRGFTPATVTPAGVTPANFNPTAAFFTFAFLVACAFFTVKAWMRASRYYQFRHVIRRIHDDQDPVMPLFDD